MKFSTGKMSRRRSRSARQPLATIPTCCFCGFSEDDEIEFGKLWNHDGIVTHYYCLLLSSNMEQNGNDNEGILGFLPADIQKELRRGKRLLCTYCKRTGATLGCCHTKCKRVFHLPCGLQEGSLHQFFGEFRSYCITHRIKQEIDEHIKEEVATAGTVTCYICYEDVNPQNNIRTLWAPCCRKNAWFHRKCVQRLAMSAGYFFKCPLCNNKQEFQQAMLEHGVFIPNQDASWELVPNAYQELLHRHNHCDAVECLCPKGRSYTGVNAKWELVLCRLCGSQGVHKACGHLKLASSIWECAECMGMLRKTNQDPPLINQVIGATNEMFQDDSSNDSDISVGQNPSPLLETDRLNSPSRATSPVTSPIIKIRPGPRSFKLQQAVQNTKSAASIKTRIANTSVPGNRDVLLPNRSSTDENAISNEKSIEKALQATNYFPADTGVLSLLLPSGQTNSTAPVRSYISSEIANGKSIESRQCEAEVILIDSDDEVEIISVTPKQSILTAKDGTKIPIHSLFQEPVDLHKVEGDVKVAELTQSQNSKRALHRGKVPGSATKSLNATDTSSFLNTFPKSIPPQLSTNVPEAPIISRKTESPELMFVNEIAKQGSVMNFKITNVTSLRREDFTNTIQHLNVITNIDLSEDKESDLLLNNNQQLSVKQITNLTNGISKPNATPFRLHTDLNMKRKSEGFASKNLHNLSDNEVMQDRKRARTYVSKNTEPVQNNISIPWSIKIDNMNEVVPILATSMPLTCSSNSNSNRFEQSTATMQTKSKGNQTNNRGGVRIIHNPDIPKKKDFYVYQPETGVTDLPQNKTTNNTNHVNVPTHGLSPIVSQASSLHVSEATKTYDLTQPQVAKRLSVRNMGANDTNIYGSTYNNQQLTINGSRNLSEVSSRFSKPQALIQQIPSSSKNIAITSCSVNQSHPDVGREIERHRAAGESFQKNVPGTDSPFYNSLSRNSTETPGKTGDQPSLNTVSKPSQSITQLANGIAISSSCDGDAGSSPAAAAGLASQAASRNPVHVSTESVDSADGTSGGGQDDNAFTSISTHVLSNPTKPQHDSSFETERKYSDKHRIIPENVPLRNLKFRVFDPKIVQIIVHDAYVLNIHTETAIRQNTQPAVGPRSSIKQEKIFQSFKQQSNSISSQLGSIESDHDMEDHKDDGSLKSKRYSETAYTSKEFISQTESFRNLVVPEIKLNNSNVSSIRATITDTKTKTLGVLETKCIRNNISDSNMNQASLANKKSRGYIQRTDSISKISARDELLIHSSFESNNRNSLSIQHKENLSKNEMVCPALNKERWNLKNLCEQSNNIISVDDSESFKVRAKGSLVKTFKNDHDVRSSSSVDFCTTFRNCSNDADEKERSVRQRRASKYSVNKSLDNFIGLNPSIDRCNYFKDIVDCNSKLNHNIRTLDVDHIQDSLRNDNAKNVTDLRGVNRSDEVSKLNGLKKIEIVNPNPLANTSSSVAINGDISLNNTITTPIDDRISSLAAKNTPNTNGSSFSIKVRIDLNRIQNLIDRRPQLFDNRNHRGKRKLLDNQHESQSLPIRVTRRSCRNPLVATNCTYSSQTGTMQSVRDTGSLHAKKKLKYSLKLDGKD